MDAAATRALYLFQPAGQPYQLARLDLNPADLDGAPTISEGRVDPAFVLTETRSTATISARIAPLEPGPWVGARVLREGLPDDNVGTAYAGPLVDDATSGDAAAGDGLFSNNTVTTNCCAEIGPRSVRVKAETQAADGRQHATAVDVIPFAVTDTPLEGGPPPGTPGTPLPTSPVTSLTGTPTLRPGTPLPPTPGGNVAAQATIAAQANSVARKQAHPRRRHHAGADHHAPTRRKPRSRRRQLSSLRWKPRGGTPRRPRPTDGFPRDRWRQGQARRPHRRLTSSPPIPPSAPSRLGRPRRSPPSPPRPTRPLPTHWQPRVWTRP